MWTYIYIKKIINESSNENNDSNINMNKLEGNIKKLVLTLNNIKDKIKKYGNKISINFLGKNKPQSKICVYFFESLHFLYIYYHYHNIKRDVIIFHVELSLLI